MNRCFCVYKGNAAVQAVIYCREELADRTPAEHPEAGQDGAGWVLKGKLRRFQQVINYLSPLGQRFWVVEEGWDPAALTPSSASAVLHGLGHISQHSSPHSS